MKIYPEQLTEQLTKKLAPLYLITGDEILLINEARDKIMAQCNKQNFTEHQLFFVDRYFDWQVLTDASANLSLFSQKQVIELKIQTDTISKIGQETLINYCQQAPSDTVLIISCAKLDKAQQNASWYKHINQLGIIITVWPLPATLLPRFVQQRLQQQRLTTDNDGIRLLINANEGNLLALNQTIEKLALLHPSGYITPEQITATLNDNAHYNIFALSDAIQLGNTSQALRILLHLQQEDVEPTLIVWAISRELRKLSEINHAISKRQPNETIFRKYQVLPKQQESVIKASKRRHLANWLDLLANCAEIDRQIKGAASGNYWQQLQQIILQSCQ